jgi:hypothetical protein
MDDPLAPKTVAVFNEAMCACKYGLISNPKLTSLSEVVLAIKELKLAKLRDLVI